MVYRKKISSTEARQGYILITKDKLKRFPPLGEIFELRIGGQKLRARVTANPCNCVGSWHDHYHLEANYLKNSISSNSGREIAISENGSAVYELTIGP